MPGGGPGGRQGPSVGMSAGWRHAARPPARIRVAAGAGQGREEPTYFGGWRSAPATCPAGPRQGPSGQAGAVSRDVCGMPPWLSHKLEKSSAFPRGYIPPSKKNACRCIFLATIVSKKTIYYRDTSVSLSHRRPTGRRNPLFCRNVPSASMPGAREAAM